MYIELIPTHKYYTQPMSHDFLVTKIFELDIWDFDCEFCTSRYVLSEFIGECSIAIKLILTLALFSKMYYLYTSREHETESCLLFLLTASYSLYGDLLLSEYLIQPTQTHHSFLPFDELINTKPSTPKITLIKIS